MADNHENQPMDDAELDKQIEADIQKVRAESDGTNPVLKQGADQNAPNPTEEQKPKEGEGQQGAPEQPSPAQGSEKKPESKPEEGDHSKEIEESFKAPKKGKFESEESYQSRVRLADLVAKRKATTDPAERQKLTEEISQTRKEMRGTNSGDIKNSSNLGEKSAENSEANKGGEGDSSKSKPLTQEDLDAALEARDYNVNVTQTLNDFFQRHPNLADQDVREVYFHFVETNYNWQGKTGKDLMTVLELAHDSMFRPGDSIQERVLNGTKVAEKVDAMSFPGGSVAAPSASPEQDASIKELTALGYTEEQAREMIS